MTHCFRGCLDVEISIRVTLMIMHRCFLVVFLLPPVFEILVQKWFLTIFCLIYEIFGLTANYSVLFKSMIYSICMNILR